MEILITLLGALALIAVAFFYSAFAWGFVTYKFWYWFLLPVFPELPEVTLAQCVGIYVFISLFHNHLPQVIKKEYRDDSMGTWIQILAPVMIYVIGWLMHIIIVK